MTPRRVKIDPSTVVAKGKGYYEEWHDNGQTSDIIAAILYTDAHSGNTILPGVQQLRGKNDRETAYNIWRFLRENIKYRADRQGHEIPKTPGALFSVRVGDCKSFSIAAAAMLRSLGIPYSYRFTSYAPGDYTHVYVVAHTTDGNYIVDATHSAPNAEAPYYKKRDIRPGKTSISGNFHKINQPARFWRVAGAVALLYFLLK